MFSYRLERPFKNCPKKPKLFLMALKYPELKYIHGLDWLVCRGTAGKNIYFCRFATLHWLLAVNVSKHQGCQIPNLGNFWRALEWKMLLYFMVIRNI
jgi:hypothetical protein